MKHRVSCASHVLAPRVAACLIALCAIFALSACGGDSGVAGRADGTSAASPGPGRTSNQRAERQAASLQTESEAPLETETQSMKEWRKGMQKTPLPKKTGCFHAAHPGTTWEETPCINPPPVPFGPAAPAPAPSPETVGGGGLNSIVAQLSSMSRAEGSFPSVTGVTSETDTINRQEDYSLQLNSNYFWSPACVGAKNSSGCQGWQQFIYSTAGYALIQYWLYNWGGPCPIGWTQFIQGSYQNCFHNSTSVAVPRQSIKNLAKLSLTGTAAYQGSDTLMMSTGDGNLYAFSADDSVLSLSLGWKVVEFNVFGQEWGSQAVFNSGATIVVQIDVDNGDGTPGSPTCGYLGLTGESNSLTLPTTSPCCAINGTTSLVFTESNVTGAKPLFCTATPEDNYYQEKTCSIPSSAGLGDAPTVGVLRSGNVYIGQDFQPAGGSYTATWTNLGHGAASPKSHPATAAVVDSNGYGNIVVLYTGTDHKIYETHQVSGGAFSPWSSATYAGLSAYSAVAVVGNLDSNYGYASSNMVIAALDSGHKLHALVSNGQAALSGWIAAPSKVLLGAPAIYADVYGEYYIVGVDSTSKTPYEIPFSGAAKAFQGSWYAEAGTTTFGTGVAASYSAYPYDTSTDYLVNLAGNASNKTTPWVDTLDFSVNTGTPSALPGTFDSVPSAGNSLGCSGGGGCGYEPILTVHASDTSCYWRSASDVTSEWTLLGHP